MQFFKQLRATRPESIAAHIPHAEAGNRAVQKQRCRYGWCPCRYAKYCASTFAPILGVHSREVLAVHPSCLGVYTQDVRVAHPRFLGIYTQEFTAHFAGKQSSGYLCILLVWSLVPTDPALFIDAFDLFAFDYTAMNHFSLVKCKIVNATTIHCECYNGKLWVLQWFIVSATTIHYSMVEWLFSFLDLTSAHPQVFRRTLVETIHSPELRIACPQSFQLCFWTLLR